jgi:hypothetical protein
MPSRNCFTEALNQGHRGRERNAVKRGSPYLFKIKPQRENKKNSIENCSSGNCAMKGGNGKYVLASLVRTDIEQTSWISSAVGLSDEDLCG